MNKLTDSLFSAGVRYKSYSLKALDNAIDLLEKEKTSTDYDSKDYSNNWKRERRFVEILDEIDLINEIKISKGYILNESNHTMSLDLKYDSEKIYGYLDKYEACEFLSEKSVRIKNFSDVRKIEDIKKYVLHTPWPNPDFHYRNTFIKNYLIFNTKSNLFKTLFFLAAIIFIFIYLNGLIKWLLIVSLFTYGFFKYKQLRTQEIQTVVSPKEMQSLAKDWKSKKMLDAKNVEDSNNRKQFILENTAARQKSIQLCDVSVAYMYAIEQHMDAKIYQTSVDFEEGAFSPFWESVESSYEGLNIAADTINIINENLKKIDIATKNLGDGMVFQFINVNNQTIRRLQEHSLFLKGIVRKAQSNFQFATIYEQKKTNNLLKVGFLSLKNAISDMSGIIESSLNNLNHSINSLSENLENIQVAIQDGNFRIDESANQAQLQHAEIIQNEGQKIKMLDRAQEFESRKLKMLDNIQRNKRPPNSKLDKFFHTRYGSDSTKAHDVSAD